MPEPSAAPAKPVYNSLLIREPPPPGGGEIISYDEANARYLDEFVIMRVTAREDDGWPAAGYVIAHDMSEERCWEQFDAALAAGEPREAKHHLFVAAPKLRTGAEMLAAMEQIEAEWPAIEERRYRSRE